MIECLSFRVAGWFVSAVVFRGFLAGFGGWVFALDWVLWGGTGFVRGKGWVGW